MPGSLSLPGRFNVADHFILPSLASGRAERPYLYCGEAVLTYDGLHRQANRVGNALRRLGVRQGQRVVLLMDDSLAFPPCFWGAVRVGAVVVPLNTVLTPHEYCHCLDDSRGSVLIVDAALWPRVAPIAQGLRHLRHTIIANGTVAGLPALESLLAAEGDTLRTALRSPEDPALWLYTSGSTGPPKAAVHRQRDMVYVAEHYLRRVLRLRPDDLGFSAPKLSFAYGLGNSLYFPPASGSAAVIRPGPATPRACFEVLARFRPTVFYGVPTLYAALLELYEAWLRGQEAPPAPLPRLEHLRLAISGGEPLPLEVLRRWRRHFGLPILDGIGSSEALHFYIANTPERLCEGSTGVPVPGYRVRLVDAAQRDVAPGEVGELWVRGGSIAPRYWNSPARTRAAMRGGWLATGDRFRCDAEGFYWYHGRNDDMLKVGGSWVSPAEVERALLSHPAVAECAVVGRPDASGLVEAVAFVVLGDGHPPAADMEAVLMAHAAECVAPFKVPRRVVFVPALPRTATGKIQRFRLRGRRACSVPTS